MAFFSNEAKEERLNKYYDPAEIIDDQKYNMVMGGVVLEGLLVNLILCAVCKNIFETVNPIAFLIFYIICTIAGTLIARKSENPIVSFVGYNLVVIPIGLLVSAMVNAYGGLDSEVVSQAFLFTLIITGVMIAGAVFYPDFFSKLGGILLTSLVGLVIAGIVMAIMGVDSVIYSFIGAVIFSLYIGFDFWRSQQYEKTYDNAVDCALDIYLDIINLFIRIMQILGRRR